MRLFFLMPLTTGLIAGYIFNKSADEMAYLTGVVTVVSFILSLVLAPWQIQLLILALVIISTRKLLLQIEYKMQTQNSQEEKPNAPSGNNEFNTSEAKLAEGEKAGIYRGTFWRSSQPKMSSRQTTFNLKYRGASINTQKDRIP
jgi:hypothetical protein